MEGIGVQVFAVVSSLVAVAFTMFLIKKIMGKSEGSPEMVEIAQAVRTLSVCGSV